MTFGLLREAARRAEAASEPDAAARAVAYGVEMQKKAALAVACTLLALLGAAVAIRFPRGDRRLVLGAAATVFSGYYFVTVAGEALADRQILSPLVAMWMANALLLVLAALLMWGAGRPRHGDGVESLAVNG
jgi:lipopolysaccharide export system permease protein